MVFNTVKRFFSGNKSRKNNVRNNSSVVYATNSYPNIPMNSPSPKVLNTNVTSSPNTNSPNLAISFNNIPNLPTKKSTRKNPNKNLQSIEKDVEKFMKKVRKHHEDKEKIVKTQINLNKRLAMAKKQKLLDKAKKNTKNILDKESQRLKEIQTLLNKPKKPKRKSKQKNNSNLNNRN